MKIFIAGASSNEIPPEYFDDVNYLVAKLFANDHTLVFGGMNSGIMGTSYSAAKENKREVVGIVPEIYISDFENLECDRELVAKTVNERVDMVIEEADVLLFLPGGIGTLHEFYIALERKRSGEIDKPIIVYNLWGFFDYMLLMLEKIYKEKFTSAKVQDLYFVSDQYSAIIAYISNIESRGIERKFIKKD